MAGGGHRTLKHPPPHHRLDPSKRLSMWEGVMELAPGAGKSPTKPKGEEPAPSEAAQREAKCPIPRAAPSSSSQRAFPRKPLLDLEGLALLVLHGQSELGGDVHGLPGPQAEVQLLQQRGEEEEDLPAADGLAQAAPLAQPKGQNLLALCPAQLSPGGQEPLGPEG